MTAQTVSDLATAAPNYWFNYGGGERLQPPANHSHLFLQAFSII